MERIRVNLMENMRWNEDVPIIYINNRVVVTPLGMTQQAERMSKVVSQDLPELNCIV